MDINLNQAIRYHEGQFPPQILKYDSFITQVINASSALARYDQMLKNMHNSTIFLSPLRNQEAIVSSRMEGTISTMDEILRYEADQDADVDDNQSTRSEVIETILYQRALNSAQKAIEDGQPISQSLIRSIHQQLLSFGRGATKSPGEFKKEQNYLADPIKKEVSFIPISPEKLQDGLDELFRYIQSEQHPPLIRTAISHVEFEALHPFKDGNGRIGRMLITLMLWSSGMISAPHFYISGYLEEHKDEYIQTMRKVSSDGDWSAWCSFFLDAVEKQAYSNLVTAEKITGLYEKMKVIFIEALSSKWGGNALDFVFTYPVFRNNKFTLKSGIPAATAARFTRILVEKGYLKTLEEASGRRPALYSFTPLLDLVRV